MLHFASKLTALSVRFTDLIDGGGIDSGRRSRLGVLAVGCKVGGAAVEGIAALHQQRQVEVIALQDIDEPWGVEGLGRDLSTAGCRNVR